MSQRQIRHHQAKLVVAGEDSNPDRQPMLIAQGQAVRDPRISLSEQVAKTPFYIRNWKWSGAVEDFPNEPWLRCVDKFYPKADGGALAIDEPVLDAEFVACERKAKCLKKRGVRYLVIKPSMNLAECLVSLDIEDKKAD